ncbi:MAG TPA: UDP-N-acetylglucosamine 1-carboxyvinyltransferase [Patescibacteria group bacterium]|nr:UDP-N-acetylglucosamine 1-carboxyvinyltransferase [Patescibacteria group bacterium]
MDKLVIEGGRRIDGEVNVSGSKNGLLAVMPATILAPGVYHLTNTPNLRDVYTMSRLFNSMGAFCELNDNDLFIDTTNMNSYEAPYEFVKMMRASINVLCPLLSRFGQAKVSLPGGCAFGQRPIDLHLKGLEKLGAEVKVESGYIHVKADRLKGAKFHFDVSSVGATENLLTAAVTAKGTSHFTNAALEPEVTALARMLVKMGAKIDGIGTTHLEIEGVDELKPIDEEIIPDRIEAATFLIAAAMTKGDIHLKNTNPYHMTAVLSKLEDAGCVIDVTGESIKLEMKEEIKPVNIKTATYPGFPTDVQAQWIALMTCAAGTAKVTDTIYGTRFHHVPELIRLGAQIDVNGDTATVHGGKKLQGTTVMSSDLRASASLILAGLVAEGRTDVLRVYHIDRGYEAIEKKLTALGADIRREEAEELV